MENQIINQLSHVVRKILTGVKLDLVHRGSRRHIKSKDAVELLRPSVIFCDTIEMFYFQYLRISEHLIGSVGNFSIFGKTELNQTRTKPN